MIEFEIKPAVKMDDVPMPTLRQLRGAYPEIFEKISALKRGTALPITFKEVKHADYAPAKLRELAKRAGETLSTSRDAASTTMYFWLEPK